MNLLLWNLDGVMTEVKDCTSIFQDSKKIIGRPL